MPFDEEVTLVHELLHVVLGRWNTEADHNNIDQEQAINKLAYALVGRK